MTNSNNGYHRESLRVQVSSVPPNGMTGKLSSLSAPQVALADIITSSVLSITVYSLMAALWLYSCYLGTLIPVRSGRWGVGASGSRL